MKKKLAVLLALCLTLGALPLSALAATYTVTDPEGNTVGTLTTSDEETTKGQVTDTKLTGVYQYYSLAPDTIILESDSPKTLTLYYGEAPTSLTVTATLVESSTIEGNQIKGTEENTETSNGVVVGDLSEALENHDENSTLSLSSAAANDGEKKDINTVKLAANVADQLTQVAAVKVTTDIGEVTLPSGAFRQMGMEAVTITVAKTTNTATKDAPVFSVSVTKTANDSEVKIQKLDTPIKMSFDIDSTLVTKLVKPIALYLDPNGQNVRMGAKVQDGKFIFSTRHLSAFAAINADDEANLGVAPAELVLKSETSNGKQKTVSYVGTDVNTFMLAQFQVKVGTDVRYVFSQSVTGADGIAKFIIPNVDEYTLCDVWEIPSNDNLILDADGMLEDDGTIIGELSK